MPTIAIPLRAPFADCYKRGGYATDIAYSGDVPAPGLRTPVATWVRAQLAAWHATDEGDHRAFQ